MNRSTKVILAAGVGVSLLFAATACSSGTGGSTKTIKVGYMNYGTISLDNQMKSVKKDFEAANQGVRVELVPIKASLNDYYTKLALMNRGASTAPDVIYEDSFMVKSDAAAGYLAPLDSYVSKWADWGQFYANAKAAGQGQDGKLYGVSLGSDTRALWYNKDILKKAGVSVPWQPKTWADVTAAAKAVKANVPGVTPINIYSGKAAGEAASNEGVQMLLSGTGSSLYDTSSGKWVTGSKGFIDSLNMIKD